MQEHELKTDPQVFDDVAEGRKSFEIRKDDRGFEVGDVLKLRKTRYTGQEMRPYMHPDQPGRVVEGQPLKYVGPPLYVYVTYILRGPVYGLADGWVIMAVMPRDGGCAT